MNNKKNVLVFFSYRNHKHGYIEMLFERMTQAAQGRPLNLYRGSLNDLRITVENNELHVVESLTNRDLTSFDLVYFELWYKAQQQALAAATYLAQHDVPYFSHEVGELTAITKIGEIAKLTNGSVPLPSTFMSSRRETLRAFKKTPPISYPLIVKAADGYGGKNNYMVKSYDELKTILRDNKQLQFVIQEFIPNDCDYRCLVLGGEIALVLRRSRDQSKDTHLNNTSAGALGEVVALSEIPEDAQTAVLNAARAMGRSQFAGVDLLIDKTNDKPYILEVNQTPQIEIGAEVDKKMAAMLNYMERM